MNNAILTGRTGGDPQLHTFESGDQIARISLATSRKYKTDSGEKKEVTQWHNLIFTGGLVDVVDKYVAKGSAIAVRGEIQYRKWEDNNGVKHTTTEIRVKELDIIDGKRHEPTAQESRPAPAPPADTEVDEPF